MPACALADGETINLSYLAAEDTWNRMRDVGLNDRRRREPPTVWLGAITCECVLQSIAAFSLQSSPMPAQWPSFIEHPFLSMQRVACIDDTAVNTVGELWERGGGTTVGEEAPWAYLPVFAFLKQFPAHSPMLLPPGFVSEDAYSHPTGRSCNWWHLGEDIGERLLRSEYLEADPRSADLYWIYGCPNGDTILPALRWIKTAYPFWNASVAAHAPRHALVVGHEEGWAEAWRYLVHWLRGPTGDHANAAHKWDELHPASPTRQLAILQLSGQSDYPAEGMRAPIRCVSSNAPCYVCFQPGKDVMLPGHPGLIDYPRGGQCDALAHAKAFDGSGAPAPRPRRPQVLFGGAVWTIPQGPDLYQPSRLVFYLCHKNASRLRGRDYLVVQSETQPESVRAWEVDARINLERAARDASFCIVPEGKAGGYGHRAISYIMLGCVPIYSKERFSRDIFDEAIDWTKVALHVPPSEMPRLPQILERVDAEALRAAAAGMRRRLLWSSIYGPCHLADGEGGGADAFDTLMEVLATPRRHFRVTDAHRAPRAPEQHKDLKAWLRRHGGDYCTATLQ